MTRHGELYLRDQIPPRSIYFEQGRFGRLFPSLPPFASDTPSVRDRLSKLGASGGLMDAKDAGNPNNPNNPVNPKITAGFTFLGQFLDHDITFDTTSSLERQNDPESIQNFRTPLLELDNVYGSGPAASPHLYDRTTRGKFLIEKLDPQDPSSMDDLPRNSQNLALIADPRNDENVIVSQLQLAFLKFHNKVLDLVLENGTDPSEAFLEAQRLVRWHYQWIILHEFLPTTVGETVVQDILFGKRRQFYSWRREPFIPVEFSVAAYRFGHSQVRPGYRVNKSGFGAGLFTPPENEVDPNDPNDLRGGVRAKRRFVDWDLFFDFGDPNQRPQEGKKIDSKLSTPLLNLPFGPGLPGVGQQTRSLAQRNLLRHLTFSLPSGQAVARAMKSVTGAEILSPSEDLSDLKDLGFEKETPLWFYLLKESEVLANGETLGPTGGRIVAEVFIGLLEGDYKSFLAQDPTWKPTLGKDGTFTIVDLLKLAGVAPQGTV